jgi:endonuclease YncB( thermonuclease family)
MDTTRKESVIAISFVGALLLFQFTSASAQFAIYDISGKPSLIDANTLEFRSGKVRLICLHVPATNEQFAKKAKDVLRDVIAHQTVQCQGPWHDKYQSFISVCQAGKIDLSIYMLQQGYAIAAGGHTCERYKEAAQKAKENKIGMWRAPNMAEMTAWLE